MLRLAQLGLEAVAMLGVGQSAEQTRLLSRFDGVGVLLDGDPAGRSATASVLQALGPKAWTAYPPDGADPDDLQDEDLERLVTDAKPRHCGLPR